MHTIDGVLTVYGLVGSVCTPNSGYKDVNEGANVVVKDGSGTTIGTSSLMLWADAPDSYYTSQDPKFPCVFRWTVDVPDADFYHVTIGRRDGPTMSRAELSSQGWQWKLSLGS